MTCYPNYQQLGGFWPAVIKCEPASCRFPPPAAPANSFRQIIFSPNSTTNQRYQTTVVYYCPKNQTLPQILSSNFSFDYSVATFIYNVTAFCEIDGYELDRQTLQTNWKARQFRRMGQTDSSDRQFRQTDCEIDGYELEIL